MSWTVFQCDNPDFRVRSVPDDISFGVRRSAMQRSEAFRESPDVAPLFLAGSSDVLLGGQVTCSHSVNKDCLLAIHRPQR